MEVTQDLDTGAFTYTASLPDDLMLLVEDENLITSQGQSFALVRSEGGELQDAYLHVALSPDTVNEIAHKGLLGLQPIYKGNVFVHLKMRLQASCLQEVKQALPASSHPYQAIDYKRNDGDYPFFLDLRNYQLLQASQTQYSVQEA
ncbi:MAG: hypothetical protein EP343_03705 [Deltaproteobacteria bacterium]|nr:MAG: hypothetical protein EP343_03705 [Deltaproteobacteria bacterium]